MAQLRGSAVILRVTEYRDRDLIVVMLTDTVGRLDVIARGAKGSKRFSGHLGLFCVVEFVAQSKPTSTLATLQEVRVVRGFLGLSQHLERLAVASLLAECFVKTSVPEETESDIFHLMIASLAQLDSCEPERCLAVGCHSAVHLLRLRGVLADLGHCHRCGLVVDGQDRAGFSSPEMAPFCVPCSSRASAHIVMISAQSMRWLNRWYDDRDLIPTDANGSKAPVLDDELWRLYDRLILPALMALVSGRIQSGAFLQTAMGRGHL